MYRAATQALRRIKRAGFEPAMLFAKKQNTARWQSGYAADCNSVYAGSIPTRASIFTVERLALPGWWNW